MPSYDENSVLTLAGLKTALTRAKAETLAAIAAAGHLSKKKVDAVPEAASAEENTFYFVKNNDTGIMTSISRSTARWTHRRYHRRYGRLCHRRGTV